MDELQSGVNRLVAKLENLKDVDPVPVGLAMGYKLMAGAQKRSPVDTGFLRENQEVIPVEGGAEYHANAEYAFYQEFGSSRMPAANDGTGFVRPTIDEDGNEIVKVAQEEIEKQIKEKLGR